MDNEQLIFCTSLAFKAIYKQKICVSPMEYRVCKKIFSYNNIKKMINIMLINIEL